MSAVTAMPLTGEWTVDDLALIPDDGLRYELVDGVLLVSGSPSVRHQIALVGLLHALHAVAPPDLRVLPAPLGITFSRTRQLQPDVLVLTRVQTTGTDVEGVPLLAVEVLSPGTRATDLTLKRHVLEQGGVPSYWLLDPEVPSLTVLELVDGSYAEVLVATGDEAVAVERPFPVTVVPADLLR